MKKNIDLIQVALSASFIMLVACRSTKVPRERASNSKIASESTSKCSQTIRYYADKLKMGNGEQEINAPTEIVINPSAKLISLTSEPPNQGKVNFDTAIESIDCNFNSDLTAGEAIYKGYIKQTDGSTTKAIIKVEGKDGGVIISSADPENENHLIMVITKWEVVRE